MYQCLNDNDGIAHTLSFGRKLGRSYPAAAILVRLFPIYCSWFIVVSPIIELVYLEQIPNEYQGEPQVSYLMQLKELGDQSQWGPFFVPVGSLLSKNGPKGVPTVIGHHHRNVKTFPRDNELNVRTQLLSFTWTQNLANEGHIGVGVCVEAEWKQVATYKATSVTQTGYWRCSLTSSRPNNLWHIYPSGTKEQGPMFISRKCPISLPMMNIPRDENRHSEVHQDPGYSLPEAYWNIRVISWHTRCQHKW